LVIFNYQEVPNEGVSDCWATFEVEWGIQTYVIWFSISIFIIPLLVLIYTYTCICREIWQSSESGLRPRSSQRSGSNRRTPFISRAKINTVKQTIAVIVMYIVCSTPFIVAQICATIYPESPFYEGPVYTFLALLFSLNSCVNPWIYLAFNRELPRLLLRHYTAHTKNYRTAHGGNSPSNSSGDVQTTSLRPFSRWSRCSKYPNRLPYRPQMVQYHSERWIVTTAT
ncbi:hypothetical protein NQ315_007032, partial [Exocentrus adspersus]